jgi:predicted AlkP superfamily phosphohydrolase/phosphomutase
VSEREFDSVIEEARASLLQLTSPEDGAQVFESVMRREEAFNGAWSSKLPDLVMVPRRDEYVYNERPSYGEVIVPADSTTGTHSRDGIFIAWGRGVRTDAEFSKQPNLRDVGPTALASLGCPLTTDMDGRALMEIFNAAEQPLRLGSSYNQSSTDANPTQPVYNAAEEAELRERLRALGYIK